MTETINALRDKLDKLSKEEILTEIHSLRKKIDLKKDQQTTVKFAETLFNVILHFSEQNDFETEQMLLNEFAEVVAIAKENKGVLRFFAFAISQVIVDSRPVRGKTRTNFFNDLLEILARFPEKLQVFQAISAAAVELIKWGDDTEILEILNHVQEKAVLHPLLESIQLLDAKVFMNTLFYLNDQDCSLINKVYQQLSSFAISNFEYELEAEPLLNRLKTSLIGEDINEILQEGAINAIINLARQNKKQKKKECLQFIRHILQDAEYLLRQKGKTLFEDIYRLSYAFDQFNLWDEFMDIPLIQELKEGRDKNQLLREAEVKLMSIMKTMRIEEYDALKIGRRGIVLAYDLNNIHDIEEVYRQIIAQKPDALTPITIVEEVDAIIDYDASLKEHLRETGQIPPDRQTINEIQDAISLRDDLTTAATKESAIVNQVNFLRQLHFDNEIYLENHLLHTLALIYAVGMFGFNSKELKITKEEIITHTNKLCEKKFVIELIEPLVRAVTLRAARFDGEAVLVLMKILNHKGLKLLNKYYQQYNFVDNLIHLLSYYARKGEYALFLKIKEELEIANRLILNDEEIPLKIARAINEGILSFEAKNQKQKTILLEINEEIAKVHSYDEQLQLKYLDTLNFLILDFPNQEQETIDWLSNKLIDFISLYSKQQEITRRGSIGLLFLLGIAKVFQQKEKIDLYYNELKRLVILFPKDQFLRKITQIGKKAK